MSLILYGCEKWGINSLRDAHTTSAHTDVHAGLNYLILVQKVLCQIVGVCSLVCSYWNLCYELNIKPLWSKWLLCTVPSTWMVRFWKSIVDMGPERLRYNVFFRRSCTHPADHVRTYMIQHINVRRVQVLLDQQADRHSQQQTYGRDYDPAPRSCASAGALYCKFCIWFIPPSANSCPQICHKASPPHEDKDDLQNL